MPPPSFPSFDDLPLFKDGPPGNAWFLFGKDDELGMLNLLTTEVVADAAREVKEGIRISLDWPLNKPSHPAFNRQQFQHQILHHEEPLIMNDDVLQLNTQSSTQWDGFRHCPYQKSQKFFNNHTQADIESGNVIGIDAWIRRGGIVGRGVLLDWYSWAHGNKVTISPFTSSPILISDLKAIIDSYKITIRPGDILFIRSGFTKTYNSLSASEQDAFPNRKTQPAGLLGLEATKESLRWLWENRFAAVAGDSPSFERAPSTGNFNEPEVSLHQWLLAGWGMPIGEMFDLERLSQECKRLGRWSFMVSSMPLNVPGGVASPPNAVAIL